MKPEGRVAVVTGAGSGLGLATCKALVQAGARVLCLDINEAGLQSVAQSLGRSVIPRKVDVSEEDGVRDAIDFVVAAFGGLHIAINCAGVVDAAKTISRDMPFPIQLWKKVIDINLTGTFNVVRFAALAMEKNKPDETTGERGVIVNTSSGAAWQGQVGQAAYSASKAGIMGLTLPVARDLAPLGIRVVSVAPGMFNTAMAANLPGKVLDAIKDRMLLFPSRMGFPEEFAALVCHIVENSYLNATTITIDGGARISAR
ncbi:MAG TPA: SDR family NAD(P)-dependent oxidoreductase [Rhizomicrobium sp.]|nr:SDR family NAD(P)-dependent oxidoreductase [Rhizomicrobium sp.]